MGLCKEQVACHVPGLQCGQHVGYVADLGANERAEVVGLAKLLQRLMQAVGEQVAAHGAHVVGEFFACKAHLLQHSDVWLDALVEKAALACAGFHGQGKGGQLARAFVQFDAVEVVGEDFFGDLGGVVAFFFVDGVEQVKGVGEHVARAAGGVADLDVLGAVDLEEVGFRLFGRDVVLHLLGQLGAGPVEQPQAAQRVVHQVAHDPVWGEELGGGGDVGGGDLLVVLQPLEDGVFLLGDVELVEPADDLHVFARIRCHGLAGVGQDGVAREQVVGHQELGVVVDALEQKRHGLVPGVAGGHHQQAVGLALRVVAGGLARQQLADLAARGGGQHVLVDVAHLGLGQQLRLKLALGGRDHGDAVVAVHVHEAQRAKAVEPGVGHALGDLIRVAVSNGLFQPFDGLRVLAPRGAACGKHQGQLGADLIAQAAAGVLGKFFEFAGVH